MDEDVRPGSDHLLIFPDRDTADQIAEDLRDEGFANVRVVREAARNEEDDEDHEWAVHLHDDRLPDAPGGAAFEALRERFVALAEDNEGWYDEGETPDLD